MLFHRLFVCAVLAAAVAACDDHDHAVAGEATGSTCPPASTLTYATFGQTFMETYCTRCHASTRMGADRNGAPEFHDFDTQLGIMRVSDHVDEMAAAGPDATNAFMPPDDGAKPTLEERQQLGEWIACGMP